jgi:hypothetical protein
MVKELDLLESRPIPEMAEKGRQSEFSDPPRLQFFPRQRNI